MYTQTPHQHTNDKQRKGYTIFVHRFAWFCHPFISLPIDLFLLFSQRLISIASTHTHTVCSILAYKHTTNETVSKYIKNYMHFPFGLVWFALIISQLTFLFLCNMLFPYFDHNTINVSTLGALTDQTECTLFFRVSLFIIRSFYHQQSSNKSKTFSIGFD